MCTSKLEKKPVTPYFKVLEDGEKTRQFLPLLKDHYNKQNISTFNNNIEEIDKAQAKIAVECGLLVLQSYDIRNSTELKKDPALYEVKCKEFDEAVTLVVAKNTENFKKICALLTKDIELEDGEKTHQFLPLLKEHYNKQNISTFNNNIKEIDNAQGDITVECELPIVQGYHMSNSTELEKTQAIYENKYTEFDEAVTLVVAKNTKLDDAKKNFKKVRALMSKITYNLKVFFNRSCCCSCWTVHKA